MRKMRSIRKLVFNNKTGKLEEIEVPVEPNLKNGKTF